MFTNFIIIIVAILLYSIQFPNESPLFPWLAYLVGFALNLGTFAYFSNRFFQKRLIALDEFPVSGSWKRGQFHVYLNRYALLALAFYALLLYSMEIKNLLDNLFAWEVLRDFFGIAPFFILMMILWRAAWPLYRGLFKSETTAGRYVVSQLRFNLPVILPWLLATLFIDLAFLLPSGLREILRTREWTQLILYALFFIFLGTFFPVLIKTVWGCRSLRDPEILGILASVCERAGVKIGRVIIWPVMEARTVTAGVMGIMNRFRYLLLTPSICELLNREELESVLAHELGHTKKRHLHFYLLFFMGYAIISFIYPDAFFWLLHLSGAVTAFPDFFLSGDRNAMTTLFFVPMLLVLLLYFRYLFGFFSRSFEREADLFSLTLMGSSRPIVSALKKVAWANGIDERAPNWHHYGIRERVNFLNECEEKRELISLHQRRVFWYKSLYLLGLLLLMSALIFSWHNPPDRSMRLSLLETSLLNVINTQGENPEIYLLLGNVRMERKDQPGAVRSYQRAIDLAPDNITALNNLAWILVTTEDESLRDFTEGLALAQRAVSLKREPYLLDTLAEAYFVNGEIKKAIGLENEAISLEKGDKGLYKRRLERFREGLNTGGKVPLKKNFTSFQYLGTPRNSRFFQSDHKFYLNYINSIKGTSKNCFLRENERNRIRQGGEAKWLRA